LIKTVRCDWARTGKDARMAGHQPGTKTPFEHRMAIPIEVQNL